VGDLFGGFEIVAEHGLFEVRLADVLAGVHVDDRERFGVLDHERAARRQPHFAVERLAQLFHHAMLFKEREALLLFVPVFDAVDELGIEVEDVFAHFFVERAVVDDDSAIVAAELFANDAHRERRLAIQKCRLSRLGGELFDRLPTGDKLLHVGGQFVLRRVLGRGAHDEAVLFGLHSVEHRAQATAFGFGQALGDSVGLRIGNQHHEATRQRHLLGEARAFFANRVLGHLAENQLPALQHLLDARLGPLLDHVFFVELHVAAIQHRVLRGRDVDERSLHARQDVLHFAEIDVAVNLRHVVGGATDVVLDQAATFEHRHLSQVVAHVHAHEIAAEWSTVALFAAPAGDEFGVDFFGGALGLTATTLRASAAALATALAAAVPVATASAPAAIARRTRLLAAVAVTVITVSVVTVVAAFLVSLSTLGRRRTKRTSGRWRNRRATLARMVGQFHGRALALPEFIRHVNTFRLGSRPAPYAPDSPCRGAVRISPLALARSCVCQNSLPGEPDLRPCYRAVGVAARLPRS